MIKTEKKIIDRTKQWIDAFIIGHNICPFAARPARNKEISYDIIDNKDRKTILEECIDSIRNLDRGRESTGFLIFPEGFKDFSEFLHLESQLYELVNHIVGEGVYQTVAFHPDFTYADEDVPVTHYTNRSPYPMIHILSEKDVEIAQIHHPDVDAIPGLNRETLLALDPVEIQKIEDLIK